jgi:aspartate/methionine/tyrosine aminotransferase
MPTPENIVEATMMAMHDRKTTYCPTGGIGELREALASDISRSHGLSFGPQNVAIQPGGRPVIAKFLLALMNPGDEVLYPNPGFPICESLIGFLGGIPVPYGYVEEADHFAIAMEALEAQVSPRTRLLILNDLHNPTSAECMPRELERLAELVAEHQLHVLCAAKPTSTSASSATAVHSPRCRGRPITPSFSTRSRRSSP